MSLLAAVMECAMDAIVALGPDARVELFNPAAERMFGLPAAQAQGRPLSNFLSGRSIDAYRATLAGLEGIGIGRPALPGAWPVAARRADGSRFAAEVSVASSQADGRPIHVLVVREIISRRRMERALQESEGRFRSLADHAPIMIWETDALGAVHFFNRASLEYSGRRLTQKKGGGWLDAVLPEDRDSLLAAYGEALRLRRPFLAEFRYLRADGAYRWVRASASPRFGRAGRFVGLIGTTLDIDDWRRAEDSLRGLNEELERRVVERTAELSAAKAELEAFSYTVAHDLRAPLRAINGFAAQLAAGPGAGLGPAGLRLLERLQRSGRRMERLIADLLELARVGRQALTREPVELAALARAVAEELQAGDRVRIGALPAVRGEPTLLRQVLHNLIGNALKFSSGRAQPLVEVDAQRDGGEIIVSVRDNGAGFDMDYAGKLFGVFQRLHGPAEFEGSGVGLAIVQRIVTRHGGRVWGEGRVDAGATFRFALPVNELEREEQQ